MRPIVLILFAAGLLIGLLATAARAEKTDLVVMDDGNRFTCEIKKLDSGLLELSLDNVKSNIQVEWKHVVRVVSNMQLRIELSNGAHYYGALVPSSGDGQIRIRTAVGEFDADRSSIVVMEPIKATFWERMSASVSTGISYTKSTNVAQFNFGGSTTWRTLVTRTVLSVNTIITTQSGPTKTNSDIPLVFYRYYDDMWFFRAQAGASRNDELGIDFRGLLSAGGGRRLVHSNSAMILVSASVAGNREYTSDEQKTNNLELVFNALVMTYSFDSPKLEFDLDASVFLNLTTWGRYRTQLDARFSLELVSDLYWDLGQVYYRFDSDPSEEATSGTDWGVVSGLRYKFN